MIPSITTKMMGASVVSLMMMMKVIIMISIPVKLIQNQNVRSAYINFDKYYITKICM